jgi:hypothetical protein
VLAPACTPASGWEKGQVENQVGVVRERFFTPRLRLASYEELNASPHIDGRFAEQPFVM